MLFITTAAYKQIAAVSGDRFVVINYITTMMAASTEL